MQTLMKSPLYLKRKRRDRLMQVVLYTCIFGTLLVLGIILLSIFYQGYQAWSFQLFTQITPSVPGEGGGILNALIGSVIIVFGACIVGVPIGIAAGIAIAEYGKYSKLASIIRFCNDILLSTPSIIVGIFVYTLFVPTVGHPSAWAGMIALAVILIPMVVRCTDSMLDLVPNGLREAAAALGCPLWKIIVYITLRSARSGIITGILLAIARIAGETAPLLFTAFNSLFLSWDINAPMANLPVTIQNFATAPHPEFHALAWAASGVITLSILILTLCIRLFSKAPNA